MTTTFLFPAPRATAAAVLLVLLLAGHAMAAPGAHGPNGEHLDAPARTGAGDAAPRLEARSELFELVATLAGGELSILVDKFETNEPVLGAQVEVESGALKATARFHADHGDYSVDDPRMLKALAKHGEHALVFTIAAAGQADLLDGTLKVGAAQTANDDHGHGPGAPARYAGLAALVLAALGATALFLRRRQRHGAGQ